MLCVSCAQAQALLHRAHNAQGRLKKVPMRAPAASECRLESLGVIGNYSAFSLLVDGEIHAEIEAEA